MDKQILKFYKLGITNTQSLNEYFDEILNFEAQIKQILENLGLNRNVNNMDRDFYRNWKDNWKMSNELIDYATSLANGKTQPLVFMNKILSTWHEKNITDVENAKLCEVKQDKKETSKTNKSNYENRTYTNEEINSLFTNLEEIEI